MFSPYVDAVQCLLLLAAENRKADVAMLCRHRAVVNQRMNTVLLATFFAQLSSQFQYRVAM